MKKDKPFDLVEANIECPHCFTWNNVFHDGLEGEIDCQFCDNIIKWKVTVVIT